MPTENPIRVPPVQQAGVEATFRRLSADAGAELSGHRAGRAEETPNSAE